MANAPFKFLDSYTIDDRDIFFGREQEIEELYYKILDGNLLIVYGSSGTGKTSLIQCGLAGKLVEADWMPIVVRRGDNINTSLKKALQHVSITPLHEKHTPAQNIKSVYLDFFKPVYLLFDQFEELFIFGSEEETAVFVSSLEEALQAGLSCKFIFVIRGEYLENISRFEAKIPNFFNNRIRVERMTRKNAMRVITEPGKLFGIEVAADFPGQVLERLLSDKVSVELTYLQVYLDKLLKRALALNAQHPVFNKELLEHAGQIDDVLADFLDEQISKTPNPENAVTILKSFVSGQGTKKQTSLEEATEFVHGLGKNLAQEEVAASLRQFVDLRILKDQDENGKYELRHDALALKIYDQLTMSEKDMLEARQFLINRFNDFQKRSVLLEVADIHYIVPFETRLFLNEEQKQFIEKSKRAARRKKNRRRNIALGTGLALIIILAGFTIFALRQRNEALAQTRIAEQRTLEAINQKEMAEKSNELAMIASRQAMDAKSFAELQARIADEQKKIATQQAARAEEQSQFAIAQQSIAQQEKQVALQKSDEAFLEKQKADSAKSEANRLKMLALSQTIAFKSLQIKNDPQLAALLSNTSYRFCKENGGNTQDAQLYSSLYECLKNVDGEYQPIIIRTASDVKAIGITNPGQNEEVLNGDGFLRSYSGTHHKLINTVLISESNSALNTGYISPDAKYVVTAYENNAIIFFKVENGSASPPLSGHTGLVRAAAFSSDGNIFATGGRDSTVIIWSNNIAQKKVRFNARIKSLSMSVDNSTIVVGCENGEMFIMSIAATTKKLLATNSPARIQAGAFSKQGNYLAFGSSNGTVNLFRSSGSPVKTFIDNSSSVDFISTDESLKVLITAGNKIIHIYNLNDLSLKPIIIKDINSPIISMVLCGDGEILVACADNSIRRFYSKTEPIQELLFTFINRNLSLAEWQSFIGNDVPYQKTKNDLP